jgi:hypothetical protein
MSATAAGRGLWLSLVLAVCCGATSGTPELRLHTPWEAVTTPVAQGEDKPIAEWMLPNGLPNQELSNTQFVELSTEDLGPGGLGGFVADRLSTLDPKYVKGLHYAPIDTCLRPAWLFTFDDSFSGGTRSFEIVYLAVGETLYIADYSRPVDQPEDAIARAAVLDFCNTRKTTTP